jgi:hypothetical protein
MTTKPKANCETHCCTTCASDKTDLFQHARCRLMTHACITHTRTKYIARL